MSPIAICGERLLTDDGMRAGALIIDGCRVTGIVDRQEVTAGMTVHDAGTAVVMPGLIDSQIHINEPGRANWEGFASATRAASSGGVTTVLDMPTHAEPATVTAAALTQKCQATGGKLWCNVGLLGGLREPEALPALRQAGAFGIAASLLPGDDVAALTLGQLTAALPAVRKSGLPLIVRAAAPPQPVNGQPVGSDYQRLLAQRPTDTEVSFLSTIIAACRKAKVALHLSSISAAGTVGLVRQAKADGHPLTAATCPHYLWFTDRDVTGDPRYKVEPPIRREADREALWAGLLDGTIDCISSDHDPLPPALKHIDDNDLDAARPGISSLQLLLPLVWTEVRRRQLDLARLPQWLAARPAAIFGIAGKGHLRPGGDADLIIWNPDADFVVEPLHLYHRQKLIAYAGQELHGAVYETWGNGFCTYDRGRFAPVSPGSILRRGA